MTETTPPTSREDDVDKLLARRSNGTDRDRDHIDACLRHAADLIRGAKALLEQQLANLAFHLATLALEEVGKANILGMIASGRNASRDTPAFLTNALQDHVKKLFWAFWGLRFGQEHLSPNEYEESRFIAGRVHEQRMKGLYVDVTDNVASVPAEAISPEYAANMIRMAESRLALESATERAVSSPESREAIHWFFEATDDPLRRSFIFSRGSLDMLTQLGGAKEWVKWLREQFSDAEQRATDLMVAEANRVPDEADMTAKWRLVFRVYSPTHVFRQTHLNEAIDGVRWVKLTAVSGKTGQVLVELTAPGAVAATAIGAQLLARSRVMVMAFNVGTLGFFWFHERLDDPTHSGRFYERFEDVESKSPAELKTSVLLSVDYGLRKERLTKQHLSSFLLAFGRLLDHVLKHGVDMCDLYSAGVSALAKNDLHLHLEPQGFVSFYRTLQVAMRHYGDATEKSEDPNWRPSAEGIRGVIKDCIPHVDDERLGRIVRIGEAMDGHRQATDAISAEDVTVLKLVCDVFLYRAFRRKDADETPVPSADAIS